MVGNIEKQDLRRGDDERPFQRAAALGHAFFQPPRQRLADRAEPAQRHRGDRARQRPVPRVEAASLLGEIGGQSLFERPRRGQGFADRARRSDPRRHARRRRGRRFGAARMKPARLSRQRASPRIKIAGRQVRGLYAKSKAGLRPAGMKREAAARLSRKRRNEVEASAAMNNDPPDSGVRSEAEKPPARELPPAAQRALAEAEARRAEAKPSRRTSSTAAAASTRRAMATGR